MKKYRQNKIIEIIENHNVTTQDVLKKMLENEGIMVTQATLSRDINELNLRKEMSETGTYIYVREKIPCIQCPSIFKNSVIDIVYALNTVVIKCNTGMAQAVCATLDQMNCSEILGTIAGDDTIFALMKSENAAADFTKELKTLISE